MSNEKTKIEEILEHIRALLVLQLSEANVSNEEIGAVLGVSYKTVERMLPKKRSIKRFKK